MSVAVQLPPTNDVHIMSALPTTSSVAVYSLAPSASASTSAEAMLQHPDSMDKSSDLPPMPVPYEDFHFSLDLPAELDLNDLQFLSSVDRKGGPSNPMTPGLTSHFMASTPQALNFGHDDVHMASRSNSRRGSLSKGSRPASPRVGSSRFSESALRPPPPPDFEPSGPNMFDTDAFASGTFSPFGIGTPSAGDKPSHNNPLFDAKEKNLLVNFLEGFEWDFDPSLPEGMPSFSAAAADRSATAAAEAMGFPSDSGSAAASSRDPMLHEGPAMSAAARRLQTRTKAAAGVPSASSGSNSGSVTASSQSPHDTSSSATSPHGSNRSQQHPRSLSNTKSRAFHREADLVNTAFGGALSEWSLGAPASHQPPASQQHAIHDHSATGSKRHAGHFGDGDADEQTQAALALGSLTGMHAEMFRMSAGLDMVAHSNNPTQAPASQPPRPAAKSALIAKSASGKKLKVEHEDEEDRLDRTDSSAPSKRELLTESEKRQNHILSEQRRRNYIREGFKDLVVLLDDGRNFGARALGLSSGFGTGVEDEGLDDRSDIDDVVDVLSVGRKKPPKKTKKAGPDGVRQRGKGRGRGGSAGGGAGSKSAVLFQAVDLIRWLDGKSKELTQQCEALEQVAGIPDPESIVAANRPASAEAAN